MKCYLDELAALPAEPDAAARAAIAAADASRLASNKWRRKCKVQPMRFGCEWLEFQT